MHFCKNGFSLLELMVVIAMISIVASAFLNRDQASIFERWQARRHAAEDVSKLRLLIERARSLSVQSGKALRLCGGELCDGDWSEQASLWSASTLIERQFFRTDTLIKWHGFPVQRRYILFLPTGVSGYQNGSFYICLPNAPAKRLLMNQSGRVYLDSQVYGDDQCL